MTTDESRNPTKYHKNLEDLAFRASSIAIQCGVYQIIVGDEFLTFILLYRALPGTRTHRLSERVSARGRFMQSTESE